MSSFGPSAVALAHVRSYQEAADFLGDKQSRRICGNNTYVERRDNGIAIRLHQTDIVFYFGNGELIRLNTGGWHTQITKQRLEQFLPAPLAVMSFKGQWRISLVGRHWASTKAECADSVVFTDGLDLAWYPEGWRPVNALSAEDEARLDEAKRNLDKEVKRYTTALAKKLPEWRDEIRENSSLSTSGDPFCCSLGIGAGDKDHLWTHLRETYVFPTIVIRAFEDSSRYQGGKYTPAQYAVNHLAIGYEKTVVREVRKYLLKHLDPANTGVPLATESNAALEHYVDVAKDVLQRPEDFGYFGNDDDLFRFSAPTFAKTRDSENFEVANFDVVWETLVEEFPDLINTEQDRDVENPGGIYVFGAGHWAVGWVEQIVVPVFKDKTKPLGPSNLHPAFVRVTQLAEQTQAYPVLPGAQERADELEHQQQIDDIASTLRYLHAPEGIEPESVLRWIYDNEGGEYRWETEQVARVLHDIAEEEAWAEHNKPIPGQEVLV